ncbi:MAG: hypothetical protein R3Y06_05830 [Faecalibacterium sp.]
MELNVQFDQIAYGDMLEKVLPKVLEHLKQKTDSPFVAQIIEKTQGLSGRSLRAAISVLPQSTQDELAVLVLQNYKEEIIKQLNRFASEQEVGIVVSDIQLKQEQEEPK